MAHSVSGGGTVTWRVVGGGGGLQREHTSLFNRDDHSIEQFAYFICNLKCKLNIGQKTWAYLSVWIKYEKPANVSEVSLMSFNFKFGRKYGSVKFQY